MNSLFFCTARQYVSKIDRRNRWKAPLYYDVEFRLSFLVNLSTYTEKEAKGGFEGLTHSSES